MGVVAVERVGALIRRVWSQSNSAGFASETQTETIRPTIMAARLPAKVGYSIPVVVTLRLP